MFGMLTIILPIVPKQAVLWLCFVQVLVCGFVVCYVVLCRACVQIDDDPQPHQQLYQHTQAEQDQYEMEVRAANIVRAQHDYIIEYTCMFVDLYFPD